jgi:hypothetical protein
MEKCAQIDPLAVAVTPEHSAVCLLLGQ